MISQAFSSLPIGKFAHGGPAARPYRTLWS